MPKRKKSSALLVAAFAFALIATPAVAAEGSFNTYLTGVLQGYTSRTWADSNLTTNATTVAFTQCKPQAQLSPTTKGYTGIDLREDRSLSPDRSLGTKSFPCSAATGYNYTGSWSRPSAGKYFFQVTGTPLGARISVSAVKVAY